jgi:plasmid stabilization system protein ParE
MSKRIVWSERARKDLIGIKAFYDKRNKSTDYSTKLLKAFRQSTLFIQKFPLVSIRTDRDNTRGIVVMGHILFFEIMENDIVILTVWDGKRDPDQLREILSEKE